MEDILANGVEEIDRTGVGTISLFGVMQEFNLRDTLPLTTTKRIPFRFIFEELKLYISGKTDNKILQSKGIHIWDGNTSREFLDKRGLQHYEAGDMGETYGFNMRHYGAEYKGCQEDYPLYSGIGFDQLANVIHLIKTDPTNRRIIIDLWNPATQHNAALPSCLFFYQFKVDTKAKLLNLNIVLRSSDYFLANNWNTITGALLVHLICNLEGIELTPGTLKVISNDTHIYKTHIDQVRENLHRIPYPYPKLVIKHKKNNIEDFAFEDLELLGYRAYPSIKADMAI
jgi:thymidylate synthase